MVNRALRSVAVFLVLLLTVASSLGRPSPDPILTVKYTSVLWGYSYALFETGDVVVHEDDDTYMVDKKVRRDSRRLHISRQHVIRLINELLDGGLTSLGSDFIPTRLAPSGANGRLLIERVIITHAPRVQITLSVGGQKIATSIDGSNPSLCVLKSLKKFESENGIGPTE